MKDEIEKYETSNSELESMDGMIAAPEHHKAIFANERVRLWSSRPGPVSSFPFTRIAWRP